MLKIVKKLKVSLIIISVILVNCMGPGTTVNLSENYDLSEYSQVEWAITKSGLIIDFRKSINGFAIIEGDKIIESIKKDSLKKYDIEHFKTIYANDGPDTLLYILVGASVIGLFLYGYFFIPTSIG